LGDVWNAWDICWRSAGLTTAGLKGFFDLVKLTLKGLSLLYSLPLGFFELLPQTSYILLVNPRWFHLAFQSIDLVLKVDSLLLMSLS
jgi:hypothetical protein